MGWAIPSACVWTMLAILAGNATIALRIGVLTGSGVALGLLAFIFAGCAIALVQLNRKPR